MAHRDLESGMSIEETGDVQQRTDTPPRTKIINDPIHGTIEVNSLCMMIIDTPQFQRLRHIKQLGGCYHVYPGASHNRFEHSIGVYYLAGEFAKTLQRHYTGHPSIRITQEDILCVEIAGLCHDLGHGPFSHVFEKLFIPRVRDDVKWKHEEASVKMFQFLLDENPKVKVEMDKQLRDDPSHLTFIKELMDPPAYNGNDYPYEGRRADKQFLYEIVANKRNEIDVDKWDYFARDCHMLGFKNNFDHVRYMKFARIISYNPSNTQEELPGLQICMRDKEANNLYDMFHTRELLYRRAYYHKDTRGVELMIADAMVLVNDHDLGIKCPGNPGKISNCIDNMEAYSQLTDSIEHLIMFSKSKDPKVERAKEIFKSVMSRKLYKCVAQANQDQRNGRVLLELKDEKRIRQEIVMANEDPNTQLLEDKIIVCILNINYGRNNKNPLSSVQFYSKWDETKAEPLMRPEVSHMLPSVIEERVVMVYCKHPDQWALCELTATCFRNWCKNSKDPRMENPKVWLAPIAEV